MENNNNKNFIDIEMLYDNKKEYYDLAITETGDLKIDDTFDTAINCALLTDGRADSTEVKFVEKQRGTIVDLFTDGRNGSKLWLLEQSRVDLSTKNKAVDYCKNALQYLIDKNYLKNIFVNAQLSANGVIIYIDFERFSGVFDKYRYDAWDKSLYRE